MILITFSLTPPLTGLSLNFAQVRVIVHVNLGEGQVFSFSETSIDPIILITFSLTPSLSLNFV